MPRLLLNIDVPDIVAGERFYTEAFGLRVGRRFDAGFVELVGLDAPLYLLENKSDGEAAPGSGQPRDYRRHWTPIHPDIVVDDLDRAIERALAAGATMEAEPRDAPYGRIAIFGDPFGHGFCLIEFNEEGYDALD